MKIALVHDWLIHMRGGEKVLEALAELYPEATIYTLFYHRKRLSPSLKRMKIKASFLHYLPGIRLYYRWLLPLLPWAIRSVKIEQGTELVISSSHCVAKGIAVPEGAYHVCYCHTPMRYLWGFEEVYFDKFPFFLKPLMRILLEGLRRSDLESNTRVQQFVSNSENVRRRIKNFYGRDAHVICPPVDTEQYQPAGEKKEYYLVVSHFVPYKRVDLVIGAFNSLGRRLLVVGTGPCEKAYRKIRKSEKISFLRNVSNAELKTLYAQARAFIFAAEEDFGIVPVEAQACGTPVIAYGKGGALEGVKTGLFFKEQTSEAICKAVEDFEQMNFDPKLIRERVAEFDKKVFKEKFQSYVAGLLSREERFSYASR